MYSHVVLSAGDAVCDEAQESVSKEAALLDEVLDPESVTNVASVVALCLFRRLAGVGTLS